MHRTIISTILAFSLIIPAFASAAVDRETVTVEPSGRELRVPAHAIEVLPNVFALGESIDPERETVSGFMIVHKKRENAARSSAAQSGRKTSCYSFMASGAKWKVVEPWVVNTSNTYGIASSSVYSILNSGIDLWESAADGTVGGGFINILGAGSMTPLSLVADETTADGVNEIYFGDLEAGTIGVTIVWGVFGGPTQNRRLSEWDQVYNTDYSWATDGSPASMDFQNIVTHELGHTFGLSDLYTTSCAEETMYGYGTEGETKKRTLNQGDVLGISTLY